jgi:replicative DNA helicase
MEESLYNLAFERAILSSIIFEPAQFDEFEAVLKPEDFYLGAHQEIFGAMIALSHRDLPIDEEFIKKELTGKQKFDERVLVEVLTANPISNTTAYVQEIKDKAIKRHLLTLTTEIKRVAFEEGLSGSDVVDLVE